ncbi:MAG: aminofutalosine synthase MqnE [Planctomycetota bacterium]|nr:aminofutalosine synthase MqnE [Planctomycetota bacterium]
MVVDNCSMELIEQKVFSGERLSFEEGLYLDASADILQLAKLANHVREIKNGRYAYYNVNTHLNPTNICVYRCNFCAFRADLKSERGYLMENAQIAERALEARARGATEIHVVGGLHHQKQFDWYLDVLRVIHETTPEIHIKAYTGVEINWFAFLTQKSTRWVLEQLMEVGLGSLPGGGAEIFHPEVRDKICEHKADSNEWIRIHQEAHELGLRTNATMLYGHIEESRHRIDHLCQLRSLQDKTGGFQTFIPLAFHPENTGLDHLEKPSGLFDLRTIALSRLMLDNFPHIKAYWVMLGVKTAQIALSFGADDLDGTVVHEKIYHDAGAETPQALTVDEIGHLIREAGREPVERDTLYRHVIRSKDRWESGEGILATAS